MVKTTLSIIAFIWAVIWPLAIGYLTQAPAQGELDDILREADKRRQEYVDTFKNFTAVETRVTELLDKDGRIEKQRKVVSDFLVYQSAFERDAISEYRMPREVDGRLVGKPTEDAIKLFQKLAKAKTSAQELRQLHEQNRKHMLRYTHWGGTLQPLGILGKNRQNVNFAIVGRQQLDGRDVVVLSYQTKEEARQVETMGPLAGFKQPRTSIRGMAYLDATDSRLRRSHEEFLVSDPDIATAVVWLRYEYQVQAQ